MASSRTSILAVARGGLLVAGALAYALDVKNTFTMNVEFYTGIDERLEAPLLLPPVPDPVDLRQARVLVADDVADTGATLALVKRVLRAARRRGAHGRALREAVVDDHQRVRLAAHRPLDHVSLERAPAGRHALPEHGLTPLSRRDDCPVAVAVAMWVGVALALLLDGR